MRRMGLILVMAVLITTLSAGVAMAANLFGSEGPDQLFGTRGPDTTFGLGGNDGLLGRGDNDTLYGGDGRDFIGGGSGTIQGNVRFNRQGVVVRIIPDGKDKLFGGEGNDWLFAGSNNDVTFGGKGDDTLGLFFFEFIFDTGNDKFFGGAGNDEIWSFDGDLSRPFRDTVFCGSGQDEVIAVPLDRVSSDCEEVHRIS